MKSEKEIQDDEIRVIGNSDGKRVSEAQGKHFRWWMITAAGIVIALGIAVASYFMGRSEGEAEEYDYTTVLEMQQEAANRQAAAQTVTDGRTADSAAYVTITEETVNDVPLYLYTPHHAQPSLALGLPDKLDSTIVFVAQAADIVRLSELLSSGARLWHGHSPKRGIVRFWATGLRLVSAPTHRCSTMRYGRKDISSANIRWWTKGAPSTTNPKAKPFAAPLVSETAGQ